MPNGRMLVNEDHMLSVRGKKRFRQWRYEPSSDSSRVNEISPGALPKCLGLLLLPTTRNPARKQPAQTPNVAAGLDNSVLLQIMEQLGLSEAVMSEVRGRLQPKPPPVPVKTPAKVVAELEEERKASTHLKNLGTSALSRRNALDQAIEKYNVQQADLTRISTELAEARARMSESPPCACDWTCDQSYSSVRGEDSVPGEGDVDMEDLVQADEHQTSDQMFSHVDHEDYVSCGVPSNQIAIYPLEGKGSPPPDPKLSDYTPYFKHGKAQARKYCQKV